MKRAKLSPLTAHVLAYAKAAHKPSKESPFEVEAPPLDVSTCLVTEDEHKRRMEQNRNKQTDKP